MTVPTPEAMESARAEIQKHIAQIAKEILEWRATGLCPDGKLREIATTLSRAATRYNFDVVQHIASNVAFKIVADRPSSPSFPRLEEWQVQPEKDCPGLYLKCVTVEQRHAIMNALEYQTSPAYEAGVTDGHRDGFKCAVNQLRRMADAYVGRWPTLGARETMNAIATELENLEHGC